MNEIQNTPAFTVGTDRIFLWMRYQPSGQIWYVEAFARCSGGIKHFLEAYAGELPPSADLIISDALGHGNFSPRPCRLDGNIDPSMCHCVLALLCRFCRERKIDLRELFDQGLLSHPRISKTDLAFVVLQGAWEGIAVPDQWSTEAIDALLTALVEVGYEELAGRLGRKIYPNALI